MNLTLSSSSKQKQQFKFDIQRENCFVYVFIIFIRKYLKSYDYFPLLDLDIEKKDKEQSKRALSTMQKLNSCFIFSG